METNTPPQTFARDERGPTATEYAIMLALIVLATVGAISSLGLNISNIFSIFTGI